MCDVRHAINRSLRGRCVLFRLCCHAGDRVCVSTIGLINRGGLAGQSRTSPSMCDARRNLGIVGPNGSGKSSLLKFLAKLSATRGDTAHVRLGGQSIGQMIDICLHVPWPLFRRNARRCFPLRWRKPSSWDDFRIAVGRGGGWALGGEIENDCRQRHQAMATMDIVILPIASCPTSPAANASER